MLWVFFAKENDSFACAGCLESGDAWYCGKWGGNVRGFGGKHVNFNRGKDVW